MNDDERALAEVLNDIFASANAASGSGDGDLDATLWKLLDEAGFGRMGVSEDFGGSGGSLSYVALLARAVGRHAARVPAVEASLGAWLLAEAERPWQGGLLTIASDVLDVEPVGGRYRITGELRRVPYARIAGSIACIAAYEGREHVVSVDTTTVTITDGANLAGEPRDTVTVDVVADLGSALPAATRSKLAARVATLTAATIAGALEATVDAMIRYSSERVQFGRRIGAFQAVQQQVAFAASESAAAGAAASAAVNALARDRHWAAAAAQARAAQAAGAVAAIAHQVHGAIGITHEHSLRHLTTRLWSLREEAGSDRVNAEIVTRAAVAAGAGGLWEMLTEADA